MGTCGSTDKEAEKTNGSQFQSSKCGVFAAYVTEGKFSAIEVEPFQPPKALDNKNSQDQELLFFLSHRGPDTKETLVRPLSFILQQLGLSHFFDQSDESLQLGKNNSEQMARAAWSCRVGVVLLSETFGNSKWCLRELNTFLLRHHQQPRSDFILLPVHCGSFSLSAHPLFYKALSSISSIMRKPDEANHEFLVAMIPRLLSIPEIHHLDAVKKARDRLAADGFLLHELWNQYAQLSMAKTEYKMFVNPNPARADMDRIKQVHSSLTPTDIKAYLEVYEPLAYSLSPPSMADVARYSLRSIMEDLLNNKLIALGRVTQEPNQKEEQTTPSAAPTGVNEPLQALLIQGAAGSGKSLFGWYLCNQYHSSNTLSHTGNSNVYAAMPLFVSLPTFRHVLFSPGDPSKLLSTYFSDIFGISDVSHLQQQPLVIVLDGLDELGEKINLFRQCKLHLWVKSTFIITCRSTFLQESDIVKYITPSNPLDGKPVHGRLGKIWLLPFSDEQRLAYVSKFAVKFQALYRWKAEDYVSALQRFPELNAFLQEPLLLFMVLNVLPELDFGDSDSSTSPILHEDTNRFDPFYLEVRPVGKISWLFPQIRRTELYALFLTSWIKRETDRILVDHRPSVSQVMNFCAQLAFEMFLRTQTSFTVSSSKENDASAAVKPSSKLSLSELHELKKTAKQTSSTTASDEWAANLFAEHSDERLCSPLRRSGRGNYSFLHKSLQEYLTALHIAHELTLLVLTDEDDCFWRDLLGAPTTCSSSPGSSAPPSTTQRVAAASSLSDLLLSKKRLTSDYAVIRFAAELVDQRVRLYRFPGSSLSPVCSVEADFQPFGRALFDVLLANRHPIACANAMTILNSAGVGFCNRDLSGLDLSSDLYDNAPSSDIVPDHKQSLHVTTLAADLSGANLCGTNLRNSHLRGVRLECANLDGADLRGADFQRTIFGQSSTFTGHERPVCDLVCSSDGSMLFSGSSDNNICQWSLESGLLIRVLPGFADSTTCLALSADDTTLFSTREKTICRWSTSTGSFLGVCEGHTDIVVTLASSPDGKAIFSGSWDRTVRQWNIDGSLFRSLEGHTDSVSTIICSSDSKTLFSASFDQTIRQWDLETGAQIRIMPVSEPVSALALSSDSKTLFSGDRKHNVVCQWSTDTASVIRTLELDGSASVFVVSPDCTTLYCVSNSGNCIREWAIETGILRRTLEGHNREVKCLAATRDGKTLFSGSNDCSVRQWIVDTGPLARVSEGHGVKVDRLLAVTGDGKSLLSCAVGVRRWCIATGTLISAPANLAQVRSAIMTSDGKTLLTQDQNDATQIRQWCAETGRFVRIFQSTSNTFNSNNERIFQSTSNTFNSFALSPNNNILAVCDGKAIRLWSVDTGALLHMLEGHLDIVRSLAFSLDSKSLFSSCFGGDKEIRQWSTDTGNLIRSLQGHPLSADYLVLSSDGNIIHARSCDVSCYVTTQWSISTGARVEVELPKYTHLGSSEPCVSPVACADGSVFCVSGDNIVHRSSADSTSTVLWTSGPWLLSAKDCKLDSTSKIEQRTRLLLQQYGATDLAVQEATARAN